MPSPSASPAARRAAQAADLGPLVEVFPYRAARHFLGVLVLLAIVAVGGVVAARALRAGGDQPVWALVVLAVGAAYGMWRAFDQLRAGVSNRRRARQVCLFEGGFAVVDADRVEVWAWPQVERVSRDVIAYRSEYGGDRGSDTRWTVIGRDGRSVAFDTFNVPGADRLGAAITRATA